MWSQYILDLTKKLPLKLLKFIGINARIWGLGNWNCQFYLEAVLNE